MILCYSLDNSGHISMTCEAAYAPDGSASFDFPEDFDFDRQGFYRIADGVLAEDTEAEAAADKVLRSAALEDELRQTDKYITDAFESFLGVFWESTALNLAANLLRWGAEKRSALQDVLEQREAIRRELEDSAGGSGGQ